MTAYRRVDDLTVTCRLTACTPGSAPDSTLGVEYGKAFTFTFSWFGASSELASVMEFGFYSRRKLSVKLNEITS